MPIIYIDFYLNEFIYLIDYLHLHKNLKYKKIYFSEKYKY